MTFRIDRVELQTLSPVSHRWRFDVKGLYGHGFYVTLLTNENGQGLGISDPLAPEVRWVEELDKRRVPAVVLRKDQFQLPHAISAADAVCALARALLDKGWGPWVAQNHKTVAVSAADVDPSAIDEWRHTIAKERVLYALGATPQVRTIGQ